VGDKIEMQARRGKKGGKEEALEWGGQIVGMWADKGGGNGTREGYNVRKDPERYAEYGTKEGVVGGGDKAICGATGKRGDRVRGR